MGLTAGKEVYDHSAHLSRANHATVESDLQPAGVGDMFKKPYPRPHWADSKKQCAGMIPQVLSRVIAMQAIPPPELQDTKPDPSVPRPSLVAASVFGPSEPGITPPRPSQPAYTGPMLPISAQTSQAAQEGYLSPQRASFHGSPHIKQENSENSVHPSIPASRSSEHVLTPT